MMQRILVITGYLLRSLFFSLAGVIYVLLSLAYWWIFFSPRQQTPDVEYYILVIGVFGAGLTFLAALTITARANQAVNYPMLVRLPSRVEYLTAVLLSTLLYVTLLQLLVAVLALFRGPNLPLARALEIPPTWLAVNILAAVLAMHASDFVAAGWSRIYIFGSLAIFLFGQGADNEFSLWLALRIANLGRTFLRQGWVGISETFNNFADWVGNSESGFLEKLFSFIFWPFRAISEATINGFYSSTQALAPAIILLYATILFMLAADLFATKDIEFTE